MSNKVFNLITALTGATATIAIALVTYFGPEYATQINTAIPIVATCIVEVCNIFRTKELTK